MGIGDRKVLEELLDLVKLGGTEGVFTGIVDSSDGMPCIFQVVLNGESPMASPPLSRSGSREELSVDMSIFEQALKDFASDDEGTRSDSNRSGDSHGLQSAVITEPRATANKKRLRIRWQSTMKS